MAHHTISRIDPSDPTRRADARTPLKVKGHDAANLGKLSRHGARSSPADQADPVLDEIVQQARLATTATGAAIVLGRGSEMICRAKTGVTAGDVVAYLSVHSAILDACLRTGQAQRCDDAESDPRFDASVCRLLGVRSILVVPVEQQKNILGVIEIFSPRPHDFRDSDVLILQGLARRAAASANIDLAKTLVTRAVTPKASAQPASAQPVSQTRPALFRLQPKARSVTTSPIHWTLLVTLIVWALLVGWMLGWAATGRSPATSRVKTPIASAPASPVTPSPARSPEEQPAGSATTNGSDASARPVLISEDVASAHLVVRVEPEYPLQARDQRIQGTVVMEVIVGKDGLVERLSRITGDSELAVAAATAIRRWRFKPLLRNGRPERFESDITLNFALP